MTATGVTVFAGVVFGLALAAGPGPMNAIIAEESVIHGWNAGFRAGIGAVVADVLFFALALAGAITVIDRYPSIQTALYLVGGVLMLYFAWGTLKEARNAEFLTDGNPYDSKGFQKALVLSITNPYQISFWLTVGIGLLKPGTIDVFAHVPIVDTVLSGALVVHTGSPTLIGSFFAGITIWLLVYPASLVVAGRRVNALAPVIAVLSAVVLAGFGFLFLTVGTLELAWFGPG